MKEVKLPSGAVLKITLSPFKEAKALYQAILKEAKSVGVSKDMDVVALYKELFCVGFSSEEVEKHMWVCFQRCTYNSGKGDLRIDESTFEPLEARADYMQVCIEVMKENVLPFVKSLYAEYQRIIATSENSQA